MQATLGEDRDGTGSGEHVDRGEGDGLAHAYGRLIGALFLAGFLLYGWASGW